MQAYAAKGRKTAEFYSWSLVSGLWAGLPSLPYATHPNPHWASKPPGKGSDGVCDARGSVFVLHGSSTLAWWRYDIPTGTWHVLADVPEGPSGKKVKGGTDLVYLRRADSGYVYCLKGPGCDFLRYDIAQDRWDRLAPLPAGGNGKWLYGSWLCCEHENADVIYAHKAKYHELYRYCPDGDSWSGDLGGMPFVGRSGRKKKSKDGGCAVWAGDDIFALKGGGSQELWRYDPGWGTWQEFGTMPSYGSTGKKRKVKGGAGIVYCPESGLAYALKGNRTRELWRINLAWMVSPGGGSQAAASPRAPARVPGFRLAPNPLCGTRLSVCCDPGTGGPAAVTVLDPLGRVRLRGERTLPHSGRFELDVARLGPGVYLVSLETGGSRQVEKLVIGR